MTDEWERRFEHIELDLISITRLLQPQFPGRKAESATLLTAGKCNSNFRVQVSGQAAPVVLRIYVRDPSACERERRIHERLRGRVPLAELLYATDEPHPGQETYAILAWVDGVSLLDWLNDSPNALDSSVAREIGETLAVIGAEKFPEAGFFGQDLSIPEPFGNAVDGYLSYLEECVFRGRAGRRLGEPRSQTLWNLVERLPAHLEPVRGARQLVHSDFGPTNLLLRQGSRGWKLAAVLDWEFAHSASFLTDTGNLFRSEDLLPPWFEPEFARGFTRRGGILPESWRTMSRLIDLVSLAGFLNDEQERPILQTDVLRLIDASLIKLAAA